MQDHSTRHLNNTPSISGSTICEDALVASLKTSTNHKFNLPLTTPFQQEYPSCVNDFASSDSHDDQNHQSKVEKGTRNIWDGYRQDQIPNKTQPRLIRNLRHQVLSLYRRLFGLVFVTNIIILIVVLVRRATAFEIAHIVSANLFVSILIRQDHVINALFTVFCAIPPSWPLWIRRICARVYAIGGIHSGCAVAGVMWMVVFAAKATVEFEHHTGKISVPTLVVTDAILLFLVGMLIFAHPDLRRSFHNTFEKTHRFLGWSAVLMVWAQTILLLNDYRVQGQALGDTLIKAPSFWMLVIMTLSIILPWTHLRKYDVRSEVLSNHALRIHFDYASPQPGSFVRLSTDSPLQEWHSFATISVPNQTGFSVIISNAGDWTREIIQNPPTKLWVRAIPTYGVMRIVPMFRKIVLVATGSGIAPCLPVLLAKRIPIRLLWSAPAPRQTFGDTLVDDLIAAVPDAVIYDTRLHGKPDMVKLTYRVFRECEAEAVIIISNQPLTQKVVYGMVSRGIPAFGAIWDS